MTVKIKNNIGKDKITRSIYIDASLFDTIENLGEKNGRNFNLQVIYMLKNQLSLCRKKKQDERENDN